MYKVIWTSDRRTETYKTEQEWDERIDYIAENGPWDLDVAGNVCWVDDGDYEEEE